MEIKPVIAIFDIGKTNKKLFLFDLDYHVVLERTAVLTEIKDEDGDPCEDLEGLQRFIWDTLEEVAALPAFDIRAINFSAYGASLVYVDAQEQVLAPLYNYLKTYPPGLSKVLYERYGGVKQFTQSTASPALGSLNSGLQLFRLKIEQPDIFDQTLYALHLPQFLSLLLCGKASADITSIGCHTGLWDYSQKKYHRWVEQEGLGERLAPIEYAGTIHPARPPYQFPVGIGLHDSSSALIPYLALCKQPFVLISTGTWCITLNPFNHTPLTEEELHQDCLCYMTYDGDPVKASRLFAGYEHGKQVTRIAAHFQTREEIYKEMRFDPQVLARLQAAPAAGSSEPGDGPGTSRGGAPAIGTSTLQGGAPAIGPFPALPEAAPHIGDFGRRDLFTFASDVVAYHQLMLDLVSAQVEAINLVLTPGTVHKIFVDGGFSKNDLYMNMLASAYPNMEVYASSVAQATALGAALALHEVWNEGPVPGHLIEVRRYEPQIDSLSVK